MSRNWEKARGPGTPFWWLPGADYSRMSIDLIEGLYYVTDDAREKADGVLAGSFDTLEAAQAAYILIGRRT